ASGRVRGRVGRDLARARERRVGPAAGSERAEGVLLDLPFGVVVVDRTYDMQIINATARRLLAIHGPALGEDVIHLAHRALREPLRDAVDAVLNGSNRRTVHELSTLPDVPGAPRFIEISSFPARAHTDPADVPDLV